MLITVSRNGLVKQAMPQVKKELGITNDMAVPKFVKVVINVGLKQGLKDPKYVEAAERTLTRISGQKPVKTLAKKSISNFKDPSGYGRWHDGHPARS